MVRRLPLLQDPASGFPTLQARWLDGILGAAVPPETYATCGDCAMVAPSGEPGGGDYFDPSTKCCTYFPALASFLVGGVLADDDPAMLEGRSRIEARIEARVGVTPLSVRAPWQYDVLYDPGARFGQSPSMRCPYFLADGGCGVWKHRNAVCMSWFCKHARGAVGHDMWRRIEQLLSTVERELARWCALELEIGDDALAALVPTPQLASRERLAKAGDMDGAIDEQRYAAQWGTWLGREREYYRSCAEIVAGLAWSDVMRIGGAKVEVLAHIAHAAFARVTSKTLPERIAVQPFQVASMGAESARIVTYSPFDPLDLPNDLVLALSSLNGASPARAIRALEESHGIAIDEEALQRLVDFGLLGSADR